MLDILSVNPPLPCHREFVMLESFTVTMVLRYTFSLKELRPQVWTNVINKKNPSGKWHAIDMSLLRTESDGKTHHFRATCILTGQGNFEFTTRVGLRIIEELEEGEGKTEDEFLDQKEEEESEDDDDIATWKWAGGFGHNGRVTVHPPNDKMPWTKGPQAQQICDNVYVGNFIAASHAKELGFNAVLNMSVELDDFYPPEAGIAYKKLSIADGAHNPISAAIIEEAVKWIDERRRENCKVLVHCRAGIGRSGSIGISYLYYLNKDWTFKDTLRAVWKCKPDIYPHRDLDGVLQKLFPRLDANADTAVAPELRRSEALVSN